MFIIDFFYVLSSIVGLVIYFLPTIIAFKRHHNNTASIAVLNLFLGWTFIGWVIFLAMALTNNVKNKFHDKIN